MGTGKVMQTLKMCTNCNCGKRSNGGVCPHEEAK